MTGGGTGLRRRMVAFIIAWMLLGLVGVGTGDAVGGQSSVASVRIDPARVTGRMAERYLGVTLDWQKPNDGVWPIDVHELEYPVLRRLMSELGPSVLRIGGTDANAAWFCVSEADCSPEPGYTETFTDPDKEPKIFTGEDVMALVDFAREVNATILFTLNLGPGPRDSSTGEWVGDNVRTFLEFVADLDGGDQFTTWEAGNEVNVIFNEYKMPVPLRPKGYVEDLATLRAMIDETVPGTELVGPASFFLPIKRTGDFKFTKRTLRAVDDGVLDGVSWHLYAAQSPRCSPAVSPFPASRDALFDPEQIVLNRGFAQYVSKAAGDLPVVNSESASVQCGGQFGISDTMLDALWWTDWIGMMVEEGTTTILRQTLVGREYAIVDQESLVPHPTFLVSVLHRRHADRAHLATKVVTGNVFAHAYCTFDRNDAVTVTVSNPNPSAAEIDVTVKGRRITQAEQWSVAAELTATEATINGVPAGADGSIPDEPGDAVHVRRGAARVEVPANGVAVVVAELSGKATGCARH